MSVGPIHTVKTHVWCTENARALHKSEYAVSLIHHMRPLIKPSIKKPTDFANLVTLDFARGQCWTELGLATCLHLRSYRAMALGRRPNQGQIR